MPFSNSILGGETLVRNAMQSEGFQSGIQGWRIARNGDAEFNNVTVRGDLITGPVGSEHIEIKTIPSNEIQFYSGFAGELDPGRITVDYDTGGTDNASLVITPPDIVAGISRAQIGMYNFINNTSTISMEADFFQLVALQQNYTFGQYLSTSDAVQLGVLQGTWATLGGGWPHPRYFRDSQGFVHFTGAVTGGLVGQTIMNLPAGYRPPYLVPVEAEGNTARARITLNTGGNVVLNVGSGTALLWNCRFPTSVVMP